MNLFFYFISFSLVLLFVFFVWILFSSLLYKKGLISVFLFMFSFSEVESVFVILSVLVEVMEVFSKDVVFDGVGSFIMDEVNFFIFDYDFISCNE